MTSLLAHAIVLLAGLYLAALGVVALVRPRAAADFLGNLASTAKVHVTELTVRIAVGVGFVLSAERMQFGLVFRVFGWMLVVTSALLLVVPWRLHRRFAEWGVPMATQRMPLLALGSLLGGGFVLWALLSSIR